MTHHGHSRRDINGVDVVAEDEGVVRFAAAGSRSRNLLDALSHLGQALDGQLVKVLDRLDRHTTEDLRGWGWILQNNLQM